MSAKAIWEVRPGSGIGPLELGVDAVTAFRLLEAQPGWQGPGTSVPHSAEYESGLFVQFELNDRGVTEAIEAWRPAHGGPQLVLGDIRLFGLTVKEARARLPREGAPIVEDQNGIIMRGYQLGLTAEDGLIVAVLVGAAGYYDFLDDL